MRIDGVTTCVGELYAGYLRRTLPVWLDTLDSLTIISTPNDTAAWQLVADFGSNKPLWLAPTYQFSANGASFNKGAALNVGFKCAYITDWALSVDCDVLPPKHWRKIAERRARRDSINGARRHSADRQPSYGTPFIAKGYFQLWHVSDPTYRRSPIFDEHFVDAGGYDTAFASQWPRGRHHDLGFSVKHLGERSRYWCGPETTEEQQAEALDRWREREGRPKLATARRSNRENSRPTV